jgi:hypothetical protein
MDRIRRWQIKNPDAYAAQVEVGKAIRDGRLVRPQSCQRCGSRTRVVAVHRDYARPLDVDWICYLCRYRARRAASGDPIPLHRRPGGHTPRPRESAPATELPRCAAWTPRGPCQLRARYRGRDGLAYCGHHRN